MEIGGLHIIDAAVLVTYLLGITALGVWMARRVKNIGDYFMPRRFGKAMMIMHSFGTGTASDQTSQVSSGVVQHGLSGIWLQWMWLFSTPFYWLIAPIMRRFRAVTIADAYALRFDRGVAVLFAVVGVVGMSVKIGVVLKGAGALFQGSVGDAVSAEAAIIVLTVMFVIYGAAGGLGAAIVTDFIQGILTVAFSFMLLPFVLVAVGGIGGIGQSLEQFTGNRGLLSLVAAKEIGVFFIVMLSIQVLVGIVAQPHVMGLCAAGRNEMDGRVGFMIGPFIKRVCTVAWGLTAIAALAFYLSHPENLDWLDKKHAADIADPGKRLALLQTKAVADTIYGRVAAEFLPVGLLGVFLATLLAAVMSSCDSFMISSSALFTNNIYKPLLPDRSPGHYVWVGRFAALAIVGGALWFALKVPDVITALKIWLKIAPALGIAFWLGLFWRRLTAAGAWAGALAAFGTWFLVTRQFFIAWAGNLTFGDSIYLVWTSKKGAAIYDPWQIVLYLTAGTLAAIVVSLLTKPVDEKRLNRFYELIYTPVTPGEEVDEPCTLPKGVKPARRRMLVSAGGFEIPVPSVTSLVGFLAGCAIVVALIGGFVWLIGS